MVTIADMRDLNFDDMHLFARVADLGTLSAVARERDVPVSQVSRALSRIEKACNARLIHRSTHGLTPTAEGDTFLQCCRRMVATPSSGSSARIKISPLLAAPFTSTLSIQCTP